MINKKNLWKNIFSLAGEIQKTAPWEYLEETDIFAIRIPENNELYFISVMGTGGEVYAGSAYKGVRALSQFWDLSDNYLEVPPETVLTIPQIMLSFDEKDLLEPAEKKKHKEYGVKLGIMETLMSPVLEKAMIKLVVKRKLDKIEEAKAGITSNIN